MAEEPLVEFARKLVESGKGPEFFEPQEPVKLRTLPIVVNEPSGVARRSWPVRGGVPIPRGELLDAAHIRLKNAAGQEIPVQGRKLATWPGVTWRGKQYAPAVQWLLLSFLADLEPGKDTEFTLEYGSEVRPSAKPAHPVTVRQTDAGLTVENGKIALELAQAARYIQAIKRGDKAIVEHGGTTFALNLDLAPHAGDPPPIVTIPAGTLAAIDGRLNDEAWKAARTVDLHDFRLKAGAEHPTQARLLMDETHLYIGITCRDGDMAHAVAPPRERDAFDTAYDDHLTVYIDPAYEDRKTRTPGLAERREPTNFVAITVTASGVVRDQLLFGGMDDWDKQMAAKTEGRFKSGLELDLPGLEVKTAQGDDGWTAELKIPLDAVRADWSWKGKGRWDDSGFTYLAKQKRYANTFGLSLYRHRASRPTGGGSDQRWPFSISYMHCPPMKMARIPAPGKGEDFDPLPAQLKPTPDEEAAVEVQAIRIEEEGPLETIVRVDGLYRSEKVEASAFTTWFHLYAERALVRVMHTVHVGFDRNRARLSGYELVLPAAVEDARLTLMDGTTVAAPPGSRWTQYRHDAIRDFGAKASSRQGQLLGLLQAKAGGADLSLAARHCWEKFPCGFGVEAGAIRYAMYAREAMPLYFGISGEIQNDYGNFDPPNPERAEPTRVNNTHEIWISLDKEEPSFGKAVRQLALPFAGAEWNCASKVQGLMAPYDRARFPMVEDFSDYAMWWNINETHWRRWYGWGDFGNAMNSPAARWPVNHPKLYEWDYLRRGGYGWANDRKLVGFGYLTAWFRSGRRAWLDYGEAVIRNAVDVCLTYPVPSDAGYPVCRPRRHAQLAWGSTQGSAARQGGQPGWVLFHLLTGDLRVRDAILTHLRLHTEAEDGGTATSSVHATRYVEYRHILNGWLLTGDEKYRRMLEAFNAQLLKPALKTGKWGTAPERYRWPKCLDGDPDLITKWGDSMPGMGHELGQWLGPLRFAQLTGEKEMAQVVVIMAGGPGLPSEENLQRPAPASLFVFHDGYGRPGMRFADLYRWTGNRALLAQVFGEISPDDLKTGLLSHSPLPAAEPERFIHPSEFCERIAKLPTIPQSYLYPTTLSFRPLMLYTLRLAADGQIEAEGTREQK